MIQLKLVGVNLDSLSPIFREEFEFTHELKENAPFILKDSFGLSEIICLYTNDRIEYYYTSEIEVDPYELFCYFCPNASSISQKIRENIYYCTNNKATYYLFELIYGIPLVNYTKVQSLNQIKKANQLSNGNNFIQQELYNLFQHVFKITKKNHRCINLDSINKSISTLSVEIAESILGSLNDAQILIIGNGDLAMLAYQDLITKGYENISFMSNSKELANELSVLTGKPILLAWHLPIVIHNFDVVIACANSQHPLVNKEMLLFDNENDLHKPKVLIDLGVPRNIDPAIGELPNIHLKNICAKEIIGEAVKRFNCRQLLNVFFHEIQKSCMKDFKVHLRKCFSNSRNNNTECFQEEILSIIKKYIEIPLDHFRSLANKNLPLVLEGSLFSASVSTLDIFSCLEFSNNDKQKIAN